MQRAKSGDDEPTIYMGLRAPVEFFERIDRWCEQQQELRGMTIRPSRPAAIRFIVHNFLLKQEQKAARRRRKKR
jgi:hypothetical protein